MTNVPETGHGESGGVEFGAQELAESELSL